MLKVCLAHVHDCVIIMICHLQTLNAANSRFCFKGVMFSTKGSQSTLGGHYFPEGGHYFHEDNGRGSLSQGGQNTSLHRSRWPRDESLRLAVGSSLVQTPAAPNQMR